MAITINQQVDYLYKKLGYIITKTDTSSNKSVSNETISSPLLIRGETIWQQSSSIPVTMPTSNSSLVTVYADTLHSTIQTTNDVTSGTNRTWLTGYQDWIPASFGATYQVKVYVAPTGNASPQTYGTQLFPDGTGIGDEWFFDYQSGVLNFAGNVLPSVSFVGSSVFVSGARYVGTKGITTIGNINFANNTISTTGSNANLYITSMGNIYVTASGGYINTNNAVITGVASPVNSQDVVTLGFLQTVVGGNANVISQGSSSVRVVGSSSQIAFTVSGNLVANITANSSMFYNTVNIGNLSFNNGTITSSTSGNISIVPSNTGVFQVIGSSAMGIPYGNTATRPSSPSIGYIRYNTDIGTIEYWNNTSWAGLNQEITSETVTPDGIRNSFTLIYATSTNAAIVTINGTVQHPGTAYNISSNTITFSEIPLITDIIVVRSIGASVSISGMSAPDHSSSLTLLNGNVNIVGNIISSGYANISGNVSANYFMGNGALLSGMTSSYGNANVSAYLIANSIYPYGNINVASYLTVNPQAGLYSNTNVASYMPTYMPTYSGNMGGTLSTAAQPNVTSVGTLTSLAVAGGITGLSATGQYLLATDAGGSLSLGFQTNKYSGPYQPYIDFNSSSNVVDYDARIAVTGNTGVSGTGNITFIAGNVILTAPLYTGTIISTGYANIAVAVNTPSLTATNLTGTLLTAAQPNVTSVGTLTSLAVTGNVASGNMTTTTLTATGSVNAVLLGGSVYNANQPYITSVGTLTSLAVSGITNVTNTTNATAFNNGALIVAGGLGVAKDVYIQGNLYVANIISQTTSILTVTDPLLYLSASNPYPYNYDIGIYSHFVGGTGNVYQHTGLVRNDSDNTWRLFSNCVEPSGGQVTFDSNTIFDSLITGSHAVYGNVTPSANISYNLGNITNYWTNTYTNNLYATNHYGTLQTAAQPNITSVGTLSGLTVTASIAGSVTGSAATVTAAAQTAITSVGTLTALAVTGSINAGSITANASIITTSNTAIAGFDIFSVSSNTAAQLSLHAVSGLNQRISKTKFYGTFNNNVDTGERYATSIRSGYDNTAGAWGSEYLSIYVNNTTNDGATDANQAEIARFTNYAGLTVYKDIRNGQTAGVGNIGASGAGFNTVFAKATSAQYADLAENYMSDSSYEAGTVLEFGGEYEVTISDTESDRVAGIVSSNPAYLMNVDLDGDNVVALALQGRVPCKVVGNIKKGDMLTSAGNGYAMKSVNKVFGSIIGKALQDFTGGIGIIEVVVGRL